MMIKSIVLLALISAASAGPILNRPRRDGGNSDDGKADTSKNIPEPIMTYPAFPSHYFTIPVAQETFHDQPPQQLYNNILAAWPQAPQVPPMSKPNQKQQEEPQEGEEKQQGDQANKDQAVTGHQWGSSVTHNVLPHAIQPYVWPSTWGYHQPLYYQAAHASPYYWPAYGHTYTYVVAHQPVAPALPPPPAGEQPTTAKTDDKEEADVEMVDKMTSSDSSERVMNEPAKAAAMETDVLDEDESTAKITESKPEEQPADEEEEGDEERKK